MTTNDHPLLGASERTIVPATLILKSCEYTARLPWQGDIILSTCGWGPFSTADVVKIHPGQEKVGGHVQGWPGVIRVWSGGQENFPSCKYGVGEGRWWRR